jgi:aminomethyltransferase
LELSANPRSPYDARNQKEPPLPELKKTPFHAAHVKLGARMVDFAGWEMPLLYTSIIEEHNHTRASASLFDVSHMGRLRITGKRAVEFLDKVCTRNIAKTVVGQCAYSLVCNSSGGVLDDIIVSRFDKNFLVVCNASNREKIIAWFTEHAKTFDVTIEDETFSSAMVAVQGPKAVELLDNVLPDPVSGIKRYHFQSMRMMMVIKFDVFRTGYTGEDGAELICGNTAASMAQNYLMKKPTETDILRPAGLGARDTLRMEAGMPLYGHELAEDSDPLSAGLDFAVDLTKDFIGVEPLRKIKSEGLTKKLVGLFLDSPRCARQGMTVHSGTDTIGAVTSATLSPTLKKSIAMAYIKPTLATPGTKVHVALKTETVEATVTPLPFYKKPKK